MLPRQIPALLQSSPWLGAGTVYRTLQVDQTDVTGSSTPTVAFDMVPSCRG